MTTRALRDYQQELYDRTRAALAHNRAVCVQLATGGGKTPVMAAMCESVLGKGKRAWIVVNRKELLGQSSKHLLKWSVPHGLISASANESRAYQIHVVSKDTLVRRYDRIKNWPDLLIFDEAHLYLDRQIDIISHLPEHAKIIGMTATPERLDGRGLSEVYGELIEGPSIPWLTDREYLSPLRYFSPPIDGLGDLHVTGTEYDEEELEALLERKKIYGELVGHYEKHGRGKPALIFCRSVKSAYQTAERFREKGFNFHCIEGQMADGKRRDLIAALTAGTIDGLTNCEIATYGLDIPRVEYGASIRPTLSRALYFQMIGRILRPFTLYECPACGARYENRVCPKHGTENRAVYRKEHALFFDHVNLVLEHQEPDYPGIPPHYVPHIDWNFHGVEKRNKFKCPQCVYLKGRRCSKTGEALAEYKTRCQNFARASNVVLCPHLDFLYCPDPHCRTCPHNPDRTVIDARQPMVVVPTDLTEITCPIPMAERPPEERRELQDRIGAAVLEFKAGDGEILPGPVGELLKIAESLGYAVLWVYYRLTDDNRKTVNVPLLAEIARQKKYHPWWVKHAVKKVKAKEAS